MALWRGARGDAVRDIETILRRVGVYTGRVDGWYGPKLTDGVKTWQEFIGARTDGVWGPDTARRTVGLLSALNPELANNAAPLFPEVPG